MGEGGGNEEHKQSVLYASCLRRLFFKYFLGGGKRGRIQGENGERTCTNVWYV